MLTRALREQLQALRAALDAAAVPGGIALLGHAPPDGSAPAPALSQSAWEHCYQQLMGAALRVGEVPALGTLRRGLAAYGSDGHMPLAVACYDVAVLDPAFMAAVRDAAAAGRPLVPERPAQALRPARVCIAACLMAEQFARALPAVRGRVVRLTLDDAFYCTNFARPRPRALSVDPGDGKGFRTLRFGATLTAVYPAGGGQRTVTVRVPGDDACAEQWLEARACFEQLDGPDAPLPDTGLPLRGRHGAGGTAWLYRAPSPGPGGDGAGTAVLIEGFPGAYPAQYLYEMYNQHGLLERLRGRGHDVLLVALDDGTAPIQQAATVVSAALGEARRLSAGPVLAGAVSMGGLALRYALCSMEARGEAHGVEVYFTIDTPHRGANTCLAVQWFIHAFKAVIPEFQSFAALLDCPANQQFVMEWLHGDRVAESPLRSAFLQELAALGGQPTRPLRLALASGHGTGAEPPAAPVALLQWSGAALLEAFLSSRGVANAEPIASGDQPFGTPGSLRAASAVDWDLAPGGYNYFPHAVAASAAALACGTVVPGHPRSCAIPTVSALDLDQDPLAPVPPAAHGRSSFDDYLAADTDLPHVHLTAQMCDWLLEHIEGRLATVVAPASEQLP